MNKELLIFLRILYPYYAITMRILTGFLSLLLTGWTFGQCAYDNIYLQDATPVSCPGTTTVSCMNGGQYVTLDVVNGMFYTVTTCGNGAFDTQLTIYNSTGTTALGYNDDACGLQSTISFTATGTGTVHILLDEYNCLNSGSCADLTITCDQPIQFDSSNLPIVVINTENGVSIPDSPKVNATMGIIYNGPGVRNYMTDPFNEFSGDIGIELRGSSSQSFPKKQYGLETRDPWGNSHDVTIFNMAYDNDWVLFAPYSDKSLIRNVMAYEMGWDTEQYAPRTQLCEVVLNGSYDGVYVFTEKIKRKDGKVGMYDLEPGDISGNEITGDYIVKVDKMTGGGVPAWTSPYEPFPGAGTTIKYQLHDPELDSLVPVQLNYIQNYITDFETAVDGVNFADPVLGYRPYIDVESFIDFILVNEVSKNVDGYRISTYLHKLRINEGGKFRAGPLWDFNLAYGNANYCQGGNTSGWELDFNQVCPGGLANPFYWQKLVQDPEFAHEMNCRYQELRLGAWHTDSLMARIDTLAAYIDEAQQRNFQRWPILGTYVWPNNFIGSTYAEEVNYLKTWLTDRLIWMDQNMFSACPDLGVENEYLDDLNIITYPNPASGELHFNIEVENGLEVEVLDQFGHVILKDELSAVKDYIAVDELADGMYIYVIRLSSGVVKTGKFSVIKTNK